MVGQSSGIYRGCCRFVADSLRGSDSPAMGVPEAALCALRSQLLMALHDNNAQHPIQPPFSFAQVHVGMCICGPARMCRVLSDRHQEIKAALCELRCQLLMALHDNSAQHPTQAPFSCAQA